MPVHEHRLGQHEQVAQTDHRADQGHGPEPLPHRRPRQQRPGDGDRDHGYREGRPEVGGEIEELAAVHADGHTHRERPDRADGGDHRDEDERAPAPHGSNR